MTDYCTSCLYEDYDGAEEPCINCGRAKDKKPTEYFPKRPTKPMTNADLIRSMTDEELAKIMEYCGCCPPGACPHEEKVLETGVYVTPQDCEMCWLSWFKSPVEVSE